MMLRADNGKPGSSGWWLANDAGELVAPHESQEAAEADRELPGDHAVLVEGRQVPAAMMRGHEYPTRSGGEIELHCTACGQIGCYPWGFGELIPLAKVSKAWEAHRTYLHSPHEFKEDGR